MKKKKVILSVSIVIVSLLLILGGNALRNNLTANNKNDNVSKKVTAVNKAAKNQTKNMEHKSVSKTETKVSSDSKVAKENQSEDKGKETTATASNQASNASQSSSNTSQSAGGSKVVTPAPNPPKPTEEPNFTVVDTIDNKTILSTYVDVSGKTVGDVTLNALMSKGISVETTGSGYSLYISAIAGVREKEHGKNSGWIYFVNGNSPQVGCGSYKLNQGDKVIWKYSSN